jgi:hypothetical protein
LGLGRTLDSESELHSDIEATPEPRSRAGTQHPSNAITNQSGHGKQFFNMLSLFEGSPSYKQRRKKVVKPSRRRLASGGTGTESESEAGIGLRYIDRDFGAGSTSGLDLQSGVAEQVHRTLGVQEHPVSRANSLVHPVAMRQSPYAQDHDSVAVPNVPLRQHQSEAGNGLNGNADGLISAPHVSSSLRSDISQQLIHNQQVAPTVQYPPSNPSLAAPNPSLGPHDTSQSIIPVPDLYGQQQAQDVPNGLVPCTKAYVCPLYSCGRLYREPGYLREHIRSHTVDKPYRCDRCFKQFSRTDHLTQHHQTHARADNGDPQAVLDLERADEEETMLMGEKICEVEVRGEVEDVAGEPGQLRGLGVVCIYPSSHADQAVLANSVDDYSEAATSPPPANFPYPGMGLKQSPNGAMAHWRAQHGASSLSSARSIPNGRWPSDTEPWDLPRSQSALGYAWDQRSVSPAYSAISAPISHTPYHRSHTTDSLRASVGYMQSAPSHKQSFDAPGYFPNHPAPGALRRHRSATPLQSHRHMSMTLRRTSAGEPDEVELTGTTSRYHPYGHASGNINHYSSSSSPAAYPPVVDQRAASTLSNAIDGATPEATFPIGNPAYSAAPNNGYYPEAHEEYAYDVGDVMYEGPHYNTVSTTVVKHPQRLLTSASGCKQTQAHA